MDPDGIEDMLFGPDASYNDHEHASDVSDDEMLDCAEDDELTSWDLEGDPLLMPTTGHEEEAQDRLTTQAQSSPNDNFSPGAIRPVRDR